MDDATTISNQQLLKRHLLENSITVLTMRKRSLLAMFLSNSEVSFSISKRRLSSLG